MASVEDIDRILAQRQKSGGEAPNEIDEILKKRGVDTATLDQPFDVKGTVSKFARPILETGGMVGGGILGAGTGIPTGPGAIATGAAGAGLGYAAGKQAANILDQYLGQSQLPGIGQQMANTAKDVGIGATMDLGGQVPAALIKSAAPAVSPVLGKVGKLLKNIGSAVSGAPANDVGYVAANPSTMIPSFLGGPASKATANKAMDEALGGIGAKAAELSGEDIAGTGLAAAQNNVANGINSSKFYEKKGIDYLKTVSPQKIVDLKQDLDQVIQHSPTATPKVKAAQYQFRDDLRDALAEQSPAAAKATEMQRADIVRSHMLAPFRVNKNGLPSKLGMMLTLGGVANKNVEIGPAIIDSFIQSPLGVGLAASALGVTKKATEAALMNPNVRRAVLAHILAGVSPSDQPQAAQ